MIIDYNQRVLLLDKCMKVEKSYETFENISDEDNYDFECAIFIEGTWRLIS